MAIRFLLTLLLATLLSISAKCQKYDAEVIKYNTVVTADASSVKTTVSAEVLINNQNGAELGIVTVPYSKNVSVSDIEGQVMDASGKVVKVLKKNDIIDRNEFTEAFYSDRFIKGFILDYGNFPYKVVYSYTTVEKKYISICYWSPVISFSIPVKEATLQLVFPKEYGYKLRNFKVTDTSVIQNSKSVELTFRASWPKPVKEEIYSNMLSEIPYVNVVPEFFENKVTGSWNSWADYGDWIYSLNEGKDVLTEEEKLKIDELIRGRTDKREIIRILYHYLQDNTRYINVVKGLGGLEPYPATYVCINRYGDCKALTIYMKSLLAYAGIESYYTIINASNPPLDFVTDFPSHQFNHALLMVPMENDTIWLENTDHHIPCGYLGASTRNRPALMIAKNSSKLLTTPSFTKEDVLSLEKQTFDVNITGATKLSISYNFKGEAFENINSIDGGVNKNEIDKAIRQVMLFDNYDVKDWKINKWNREASAIQLTVNMELNNLLKPIGKDYYLALSSGNIPLFTSPALRKLPVVVHEPKYYIDSLIYNVPEGYTLKKAFAPVFIESPYGNYTLAIETNNNKIIARREFYMVPGLIALDKYPEFYSFIEKVHKLHTSKIIISPLNL